MVTTSSLSAQQRLHKLAALLCSAVTLEGNPLQSIVSQLPAFISQDYCGRSSFPTLILHNKNRKHGGIQLPDNIGLKDTAILNLALPFYCSIGEIEAAPMIMLQNLSQSFSSLIGSRLRSCVIALMTQTINGVKGYHHRTGQNEVRDWSCFYTSCVLIDFDLNLHCFEFCLGVVEASAFQPDKHNCCRDHFSSIGSCRWKQ